jgi:hypothetical protein
MRRALPALALLALIVLAGPAGASTVIPLTDEDLSAGADVIVRGHVARIISHADASGEIATYITLSVHEILKGALAVSELTIRESGGTVGDRHTWASANPQFVVGEPVLLFLDQRDDGTLRTYQFYMGKFTIVTDPGSGDQVALRGVPSQVTVLGGLIAPPVRAGEVARGLDEFRRFIVEHAFDPTPPSVRPRPLLPVLSASVPTEGTIEDHQEFRFIVDPDPPSPVNPSQLTPRWIQADTNTPVTIRIFASGEPAAPSLGFDQVRAAMRAWSRVPTSSFRFVEGAPIAGNNGHVTDGVSAVSFRDPLGQISNPSGCSGILAMTWTSWSGSLQGQTTVNGRTFGRMVEADVVTADGWTGCGFYENFGNFTTTMVHELGHGLGLGHSADFSSDFVNLGGRSGATMNAFVHFDGRGNGLHADDRAGVTFIYPGRTLAIQIVGSGTVTSGTDGLSCPADCVAGFAPNSTVILTPTAAPGWAFSGFSGSGCGPAVVMSADRTCTATFASGTPGTFQDVTTTHPFYPWIEEVAGAGIAGGCSTNPPLFCPNDVIVRSVMAGWLLRGMHGGGFVPPPPIGMFADVSIFDPAAPWIEQLAREAVTSGCGQNPPIFCPGSGVTRGQMAVFLLRAEHGPSYQPPPATGMFTDVPANHMFARWIEQLAREGITQGCGPTTYCPDATVTRGQMAVFVARAFGL